jgi:hypothetical protein
MAQELTAEDKAWIDTPIDVQVAPDEQRWLDTMLEMGKEEIYKYAMYNYGLEEQVVRASTKNGLLQLILLANRAGGGGAVLRARYRYLNNLKGILPPMTTVRKGGRRLYLTRGEGTAMQVLDKASGEWLSYAVIAPKESATHHIATDVANEPSRHTGVRIEVLLPLLPKMSREQLQNVAQDIDIEDADDLEQYPTNKALSDKIQAVAGVSTEETDS